MRATSRRTSRSLAPALVSPGRMRWGLAILMTQVDPSDPGGVRQPFTAPVQQGVQ